MKSVKHIPVALLLLLLWACSDDQPTGKAVNNPCDYNDDCADGICHSGVCASPSPRSNGQSCKGHGECKSLSCVNLKCVPGDGQGGKQCINHEECTSGVCKKGECTGKIQPDAGADSAPPDQGKPDAPSPDLATPDLATPDLAKPDQGKLDLPAPDLAVPDLPAPDMSLCGNGKLDPGEQCDKTVPPAATCTTLGFTAGTVSCRTDCAMSTLGCHEVEDPGGIKIGADKGSSFAAVASNGKDFLVAWVRSSGLYAARVDASGKVLDTTPIYLGVNGGVGYPFPAVAFGGSNYLVVWQIGKYLVARRVTPQGKALDGLGIPIHAPSHNGKSPALAFDGTNFLLVWSDNRGPGVAIYATRISTAGKVLESKPLRVNQFYKHERTNPAVAFDGTNFMVVYDGNTFNKTNKYDLWANRLSTSLGVLDKTDIHVSASLGNQELPSVAFGKTNFMVVWIDDRTGTRFTGGARVTKTGKVLDPNGLMAGHSQNCCDPPGLGHDGQHFFVTWVRNAKAYHQRTEGWRLDAQGNPVDSWFLVSTKKPLFGENFSVLGFGGGRYLSVWTDHRTNANQIYGTRVRFGKP